MLGRAASMPGADGGRERIRSNVLHKLRQKAGEASPAARADDRPAGSSDPLEPPWTAPVENTGETVFADRPLRFRSLTVAEADLSVLEAPEGFHGGFKIRVAKLGGRRREAGKLVERRYAGRGYTIPSQPQDPQLSTFIAYDEGQLVGTVSVRLDSDKGLSADDLYRNEIDALRSAGARICEFTRLAVDKTAASKPVLAGLFHTAYLYASVIRGCTHAVIEVNPRHVAFYGTGAALRPDRRRADEPARQRPRGIALRALCDDRRRNREVRRQARCARAPDARSSSTGSRRRTSRAC